MSLPRRRLADRARHGEPLTGALVRMPAEELVEMLAVAGLDFVLIDCEHGPADVVDLRRHIAAVQNFGVEVMVRVGQHEPALILRALDAGATGILVPHVDTPGDATAAVEAAHYPPTGRRGFATYGRAGRFGLVEPQEYRAQARANTLVFAMPESPRAAELAAQTMAVDGLDGYLIGMADLAAATGPEDRGVAESVAMIHAAGRAHGKIRMDIVNSTEAARAAREQGAQVILYNLTAVLMSTFAGLTAQ